MKLNAGHAAPDEVVLSLIRWLGDKCYSFGWLETVQGIDTDSDADGRLRSSATTRSQI